tara:strand:+ start:10843 stop:13278 length:2436 start_codon:yes stop_codon:yes gene_type:complete
MAEQPTGGLGEYFAGRYYPTATALDPEVEANLRARYSEAFSLLARTENQWKTETIESHSNIQVALMNSFTKSLQAAASSAMAGATSQRAQADLLGSLMKTYKGSLDMLGTVPDSVLKGFIASDQSMQASFEARNRDLMQELRNLTPEQAREKISLEYGSVIRNTFGNANGGAMGLLVRDGNPVEVYNARIDANRRVSRQADDGYTKLLAMLSQSKESGHIRLFNELANERAKGDHGSIINNAITQGLQRSLYAPTTGGANASQIAAAESKKFLQEQIEYAKSFGAGIPPQMLGEVMSLYDASSELALKGPEGYAAGLAKMQSPAEFDEARSILRKGLETLAPTDALTASVRNWFAMPGFSRWAAINGFTDPMAATRYASRHPDEFVAFTRLNESDPDIDLGELQRRMQQEGIYRTKGPLKTKYLSKPIERALGVGIKASTGRGIFHGDTSIEKAKEGIAYATEELEALKKKDQPTPAQGQQELPDADLEELPEAGEDPTEVTQRPNDPAFEDDEVRASDRFLASITPEAQDRLKNLTGAAKKRELKRILRASKGVVKRLEGQKADPVYFKHDDMKPLPEPTPQQETAPEPKQRKQVAWGSWATSWSNQNPEKAEAASNAVEKLVFGDSLNNAELAVINSIPPNAIRLTAAGKMRLSKLLQDQKVQEEISKAINTFMTEQGGRDPVILPTEPREEPEPLPAGFPTEPAISYENVQTARAATATHGFGGLLPDGTPYRVTNPDNAVRAANQPPTTREEVEKFGGEFGRVVDGKWVADATADTGAVTSTSTAPLVDGVIGGIGGGLGKKARGRQ